MKEIKSVLCKYKDFDNFSVSLSLLQKCNLIDPLFLLHVSDDFRETAHDGSVCSLIFDSFICVFLNLFAFEMRVT